MKKLIIFIFCLFSVSLMAQSYQYIPNANTKLLYHLNGNSTDASGNGNNGTDTNITYSLSNGKFNQGAGFNGISSFVSLTDNSSLKPTGAFTFNCWINGTDKTSYQNIFSSYRIITGPSGIWIRTDITTGYTTFGIGRKTGTPNYAEFQSTVSVKDGLWHNCVFICDGANLYVYLNGKINNYKACNFYAVYETTSYVRLGCRSNDGTNTQFFKGSIDEVIFENTAWSPEKVKKYYTYSKGWFLGFYDKTDIQYLKYFIPKSNIYTT